MAIFVPYSERIKRKSNGDNDVYQYELITDKLKNQFIHIIDRAIGLNSDSNEICKEIVYTLRDTHGLLELNNRDFNYERSFVGRMYVYANELKKYISSEIDVLCFLDIVEICFSIITSTADEAINDLNIRFKENGVGYYYADGQINRIDNELIHKEAVIPALTVLRQKGYESAQKEFLSAHEHYRHGKHSEALVECNKAFESTLKIICTKRNWAFDPKKATAEPLVQICIDNQLIPDFWKGHFSGLIQVLKSSISTPRNRLAGHGSGAIAPPEIPTELISYVLHMTASTILFLSEAEKRLR